VDIKSKRFARDFIEPKTKIFGSKVLRESYCFFSSSLAALARVKSITPSKNKLIPTNIPTSQIVLIGLPIAKKKYTPIANERIAFNNTIHQPLFGLN